MGFLDSKGDQRSSTFGFDPKNWLQPKAGAGGGVGSTTPFIAIDLEKGMTLFNVAFRKKFKIKDDFKVAFNIASFDTCFVVDPPKDIPFFNVKFIQKSGVSSFSSKHLAKEIKEAYEIKGDYKKVYLRPLYYGQINDMEMYKMVPYKDKDHSFYEAKAVDLTGDRDPNQIENDG